VAPFGCNNVAVRNTLAVDIKIRTDLTRPDLDIIGPAAQDFFAAFNVGDDNRHITDIDEGGVALAAIQGLNQKLEAELKTKDAQLAEQRRVNERQEEEIGKLMQAVEQLRQRLDAKD